MDISIDLLFQWDPKVQRFLQTSFVVGMDKEDLAQELRFAIMKAAEGFDESKGVSFHTYLHITMVNTLRTLISKAQRNKKFYEAFTIDGIAPEGDDSAIYVSNEIQQALEDPTTQDQLEQNELNDLLIRSNLNRSEILFTTLRIEGMTMTEITEEIGESAYKLRQSAKRKLSKYFDNTDWLGEEDAYKETN